MTTTKTPKSKLTSAANALEALSWIVIALTLIGGASALINSSNSGDDVQITVLLTTAVVSTFGVSLLVFARIGQVLGGES
jgi:hypothetical protein